MYPYLLGDMDPKLLHPLYCLFLNNREQVKYFSPDNDSCTTSASWSKVESDATMETDDAEASESPSLSIVTL
jgi:hypothetical protein